LDTTFKTTKPSKEQLHRVLYANIMFFFVFGVVDNGLMIMLGDLLDNTMCVVFGMSTLAAASIANGTASGLGIIMGGTFEFLGF